MDESRDDDVAVLLPNDIGTAGLATVEVPLSIKPTQEGADAALALMGGIEELSRVTADEVQQCHVKAMVVRLGEWLGWRHAVGGLWRSQSGF